MSRFWGWKRGVPGVGWHEEPRPQTAEEFATAKAIEALEALIGDLKAGTAKISSWQTDRHFVGIYGRRWTRTLDVEVAGPGLHATLKVEAW